MVSVIHVTVDCPAKTSGLIVFTRVDGVVYLDDNYNYSNFPIPFDQLNNSDLMDLYGVHYVDVPKIRSMKDGDSITFIIQNLNVASVGRVPTEI